MNNEKFDFFGNEIIMNDIKIITIKLVVEKAMFGLFKKEFMIPVLVLKSSEQPLLGTPLTGSEAGEWLAYARNYIEVTLGCEVLEHVKDDGIHAFVFL